MSGADRIGRASGASENGMSLRYRLIVLSRVLAAAVGGYALTSAITVLLALVWPLPRAQAVYTATMLSFALYVPIVLWVFTAKQVGRVWRDVAIATAIVAVLAWWLIPEAGL